MFHLDRCDLIHFDATLCDGSCSIWIDGWIGDDRRAAPSMRRCARHLYICLARTRVCVYTYARRSRDAPRTTQAINRSIDRINQSINQSHKTCTFRRVTDDHRPPPPPPPPTIALSSTRARRPGRGAAPIQFYSLILVLYNQSTQNCTFRRVTDDDDDDDDDASHGTVQHPPTHSWSLFTAFTRLARASRVVVTIQRAHRVHSQPPQTATSRASGARAWAHVFAVSAREVGGVGCARGVRDDGGRGRGRVVRAVRE